MIEVKTQYPFIDADGNERNDLIKHYAEDENGKRYYIIQDQTGNEYEEAVDLYPTNYTYSATDKEIEEPEE